MSSLSLSVYIMIITIMDLWDQNIILSQYHCASLSHMHILFWTGWYILLSKNQLLYCVYNDTCEGGIASNSRAMKLANRLLRKNNSWLTEAEKDYIISHIIIISYIFLLATLKCPTVLLMMLFCHISYHKCDIVLTQEMHVI